jgi:tripartite-type tricarboxylate transporter receptor subunit TctC
MRIRIGTAVAALIAGAALATGLAGTAGADEATDFFKGKTINVVVGFGSGGGYGHYCQQLVEYWGKLTPGNPSFICQYMSGAGGVKAANYMYNAAPRDGSYISMLSDYGALAQILEPHKVKYDARKFKWVGIMVPSNPAMMVRAGAGVKNFDELFKKQIVVGVVGMLGQDGINAQIMDAVLGAKLKIVSGYSGTAPIALAMEKGEVDASISSWISWKTRAKAQIAEGKFLPLIQIGFRKAWDLPKVPLLSDYARNDADRQVLDLASGSAPFGRSVTVPPGYPPKLLAALRKSFMATMQDKEFLATAKKRNIEIDPMPGEKIEPILEKVMATPAPIIERFRKLVGIKSS